MTIAVDSVRQIYRLHGVTVNRSVARPLIPREHSHEAVGVDGSVQGGLRPLSGWKYLRTLSFPEGELDHGPASRPLGVFPVDFLVGSSWYGYGFVFRARREDPEMDETWLSDVFIDWWDSDGGEWKSMKVMEDVDPERDMDVVSWGRFVFVLVEGRSPSLFFLEGTESPFVPRVIGLSMDEGPLPGPGKAPRLLGPEDPTVPGGVEEPSEEGGLDATAKLHLLGGDGGILWLGTFDEDEETDAVLLKPGDYSFAYRLTDSRTGRKGAISASKEVRRDSFEDDEDPPVEQQRRAWLEIVYDSTKWDTVEIYRSVRVQDAGGVYVAAILHRDSIQRLEKWWTDENQELGSFDPAGTDWRQSFIPYREGDLQLVVKDPYVDKAWFDEKMPFAGTGCVLNGCLLVASVDGSEPSSNAEVRPEDDARGLGEMRWSSTVERSPELFPPENKYVPSVPSNRVMRMMRVGNSAVGLSHDRVYFVRRTGYQITVEDILEGQGLAGRNAVETVSDSCFMITTQGLRSVGSDGAYDEYRNVDRILKEEWHGQLDQVSMAFDSGSGCLILHNPVQERMVMMWFPTGIIGEMVEVPFVEVASGFWPRRWEDDGDSGNVLEGACFGFQDLTESLWVGDDPEVDSALGIRVFMLDGERLKRRTGAADTSQENRRISTLDPSGDLLFRVVPRPPEGITGSVYVDTTVQNIGTRLEGTYLHVVKSKGIKFDGRPVQGSSWRLLGGDPVGGRLVPESNLLENALSEGDVVAVSPVVFRWGGSVMGQTNEVEEHFGNDLFQMRHISGLGTHWVDVRGIDEGSGVDPEIGPVRFWSGLVFRGAEKDPQMRGRPRSVTEKGGTEIDSLREGSSVEMAGFSQSVDLNQARRGYSDSTVAPGIEVAIPDLDFRLVAVMLKGSMKATDTDRLRSR